MVRNKKIKPVGQEPAPEHKTPRVPMQVPKPWMELARALAAKHKQPTLWYLLSLIADEAEKVGLSRPALPWEGDNLPVIP